MGMQKKSKHLAYQVGHTKQTKTMTETNQHAALAAALQKAQSEFETPEKDATNAYLHNKYASLKSCLNTLKPTLHQNGFALVQEGGKDEFGHFMETKFIHETGEFFSSRII